jgi:hypothetical protein
MVAKRIERRCARVLPAAIKGSSRRSSTGDGNDYTDFTIAVSHLWICCPVRRRAPARFRGGRGKFGVPKNLQLVLGVQKPESKDLVFFLVGYTNYETTSYLINIRASEIADSVN